MPVTKLPQTKTERACFFQHIVVKLPGFDDDGIKNSVFGIKSRFFNKIGHQALHPLGNGLQSMRSVINRIHRGHHCKQNLSRADIGGRLVATNVLLAGLERKPVGRASTRVLRNSNQTSGELSFQRIATGNEGGVWSPEPKRHSKSLRTTNRNVRTPFPRRSQQSQRQEISSRDQKTTRLVHLFCKISERVDRSVRCRILHQRRKKVGLIRGRKVSVIAGDHLQPKRFHSRPHHIQRLRMHRVAYEDDFPFWLGRGRDADGFRRGGAFIQKRGVGDWQTGEVANHGLKIEQRLQTTLGNLGLVGGVGCIPGRILQDVALNHTWSAGSVVSLADKGSVNLVLVHQVL